RSPPARYRRGSSSSTSSSTPASRCIATRSAAWPGGACARARACSPTARASPCRSPTRAASLARPPWTAPSTPRRPPPGAARDALHAVRDAVFVREQGVPVALEHDALDRACVHVLARTPSGDAIGTGRLVPPGEGLPARIGRMAVLPAWRGRGVGATLLQA